MSDARYDPQEIEPRWQAVWADEKTWEVENRLGGEADGNSSYVLEMLPYPSGEPHIGHLKVYSVGDAVATSRWTSSVSAALQTPGRWTLAFTAIRTAIATSAAAST